MDHIWGKSYKNMVLDELKKNCRRSDRDISKIINIHPSTVGRIRNNLEEQGNIIGYTVCRDYHKAKYQMSLICLKTKFIDKEGSEKIASFFDIDFNDDDENETILIDAYESFGLYDYILTIATKDQSALKRFMDKLKLVLTGYLNEEIDVVNISKIYKKNEIAYNRENELL